MPGTALLRYNMKEALVYTSKIVYKIWLEYQVKLPESMVVPQFQSHCNSGER